MNAQTSARPPVDSLFAQRTTRLRSSAIRDLLKLTEQRDVLSLAGGLPTPESFPMAELRREADRLLGEFGPSAVQYSATDGVIELRRWIAEWATESFGRPIPVEGEILVTHGSQQALDLLAKVLLNPGDTVVMQTPAYLGAIQSMELFEPKFEAVPGDADGLDTEIFEARLVAGLRPKLVYVVANFHNPSGATLSLARRQHLVRLADQYGFIIVEDDPYGAIRFSGEHVAPIASMSDRVVHLSTFSKIVAPGFRVGWMVGPPALIAMCAKAKQAADLHTQTFGQQLLASVISQPGWLAAQKTRIVPMYRDRCNALANALQTQLGDRIEFARPEGGMFLWSTVGEITNANEFLAHAVTHGVAFVPGSAFTIDQAPSNTVRFSYSTLTPTQLGSAVERLTAALDTFHR
jgi:2-aminoadipate transaminase